MTLLNDNFRIGTDEMNSRCKTARHAYYDHSLGNVERSTMSLPDGHAASVDLSWLPQSPQPRDCSPRKHQSAVVLYHMDISRFRKAKRKTDMGPISVSSNNGPALPVELYQQIFGLVFEMDVEPSIHMFEPRLRWEPLDRRTWNHHLPTHRMCRACSSSVGRREGLVGPKEAPFTGTYQDPPLCA
jgi:hypothetical protein